VNFGKGKCEKMKGKGKNHQPLSDLGKCADAALRPLSKKGSRWYAPFNTCVRQDRYKGREKRKGQPAKSSSRKGLPVFIWWKIGSQVNLEKKFGRRRGQMTWKSFEDIEGGKKGEGKRGKRCRIREGWGVLQLKSPTAAGQRGGLGYITPRVRTWREGGNEPTKWGILDER